MSIYVVVFIWLPLSCCEFYWDVASLSVLCLCVCFEKGFQGKTKYVANIMWEGTILNWLLTNRQTTQPVLLLDNLVDLNDKIIFCWLYLCFSVLKNTSSCCALSILCWFFFHNLDHIVNRRFCDALSFSHSICSFDYSQSIENESVIRYLCSCSEMRACLT
jgi:hypothetical protein